MAWCWVGLRAVPNVAVEPAETEVAVGDQRAHLELGGQGHRGVVVRLGRLHVEMGMMRDNFAKQAEEPCLITAFPSLASERQGALGRGAGVLEPVREEIGPRRAARGSSSGAMPDFRRLVSRPGLLQQDTPSPTRSDHAYTCAQGRHDDRIH